jgi:DNA-binding transcriptional LysR family regulator
VLIRHARRLFQEEHDAERAVQDLLGLERGRLAVGASTTLGNYLVPGIFGDLHRRHPQVTLALQIGNTAQIQQALLEGELDVGLTEGLVASEGLRIEVFSHDEMVLIVAPDHALASEPGAGRSQILSLTQLSELPFIVRERGSGTREVVEDALSRRGVKLREVMRLGSTEAIKNAVASGLGAAMVSRWTVEIELSSGRLRELPVRGLRVERALHLLTLEGKEPSPVSREFLRVLRRRQRPERGAQGTSPTPAS